MLCASTGIRGGMSYTVLSQRSTTCSGAPLSDGPSDGLYRNVRACMPSVAALAAGQCAEPTAAALTLLRMNARRVKAANLVGESDWSPASNTVGTTAHPPDKYTTRPAAPAGTRFAVRTWLRRLVFASVIDRRACCLAMRCDAMRCDAMRCDAGRRSCQSRPCPRAVPRCSGSRQ